MNVLNDDCQVGSDRVFSYRLIEFVDPNYLAKELLADFHPQEFSEIKLPSESLPLGKDEPKSP